MKHKKLVTTSVCVVLVSCVCTAWAQNTNQPAVPPGLAARGQRGAMDPLQMMKQYLGLSDEQANKLEPVLKEQQDKLNALRRNTSLSRQERLAKLRELQKVTDDKIKAVLTPTQADKWQRRLERAPTPGHQGTNTAKFH
jgi:periplasmic protein CpxP/Spy